MVDKFKSFATFKLRICNYVSVLKKYIWLFAQIAVFLQSKTLPRLVAGARMTQEESPGSIGHPTSESGSCG